jgi:hypothetical protein
MIEFKPRYFVLPAIALTVLAILHAPADSGQSRDCGPSIRIADPGIRESFATMARQQSRAAKKICAVHANNSAR